MTDIQAAQKLNRIWRDLGMPAIAKARLPIGAGACKTPAVHGTPEEIVERILAQTTGYEPRRSEA